MASLLWFVGRHQVEAGAASGLRAQGHGLPFSSFARCSERLSNFPYMNTGIV